MADIDSKHTFQYNPSRCSNNNVIVLEIQVMFRLIYVTDLHGWADGYEQIAIIAKEEEITTIVNGGDMFPHAQDLISTQRRFIAEYLQPYFEKLDAAGISYYGMLANDDCQAVLPDWQALVSTYPRLYDLTDGWIPLGDGLTICGCNYIPDPPFRLKDWCVLDMRDYVRPTQHPNPVISQGGRFQPVSDIDTFFKARPTLEEILDTIAERASAFERAVLACHTPPQGMGLGNTSPEVDVGSAAVKAWIEKHRPLLTLHGHIHESYRITGTDTVQLGRTTVHQPGQERFAGRLVYSIVDIEADTVFVERRSIVAQR